MIERTFDADFFNRICNLPEVRPTLGGEGYLDCSPIVSNPANFALRTEHGGFILQSHGAGFYSVHTQFASEGRGAHAIAAMRAGLDFMFTRTDAMQISSHCPDSNPAALALAVRGGARKWFFKAYDPLLGPGQVVAWDALSWMVSEPDLEREGQLFHDLLEHAKEEAGSELPAHPDDCIHDRAVGAASLMCKRGQAKKGVLLYNLWAAAAGYAPAQLLADNPPLVDIGDAVMGLTEDGELEVMACR